MVVEVRPSPWGEALGTDPGLAGQFRPVRAQSRPTPMEVPTLRGTGPEVVGIQRLRPAMCAPHGGTCPSGHRARRAIAHGCAGA